MKFLEAVRRELRKDEKKKSRDNLARLDPDVMAEQGLQRAGWGAGRATELPTRCASEIRWEWVTKDGSGWRARPRYSPRAAQLPAT